MNANGRIVVNPEGRSVDEGLRDDEPALLVCRSKLNPAIWYCFTDEGGDLSNFESPGFLNEVKRYSARTFARGRTVRWERFDNHSWRMRIVRKSLI